MLYMVDPAGHANVKAKEKNCKWNALKMEGNRRKMYVVFEPWCPVAAGQSLIQNDRNT